MTAPLLGIVLVLSILGAMIGILWIASRRQLLAPELSRKGVHIGMALVVLAFPWLFHETWPVVVLGALAIVGLATLRHKSLRAAGGPGAVLLAVQRESLGEFYFPIAVVALFILSRGDVLLYSIPILVLGLADAAAALVGVRFGKHFFFSAGHRKSYEGSAAFFFVAALCVLVPLEARSPGHWGGALATAALVATVTTCLEALSLEGRDNLFIPFATFVLLKLYMGMDDGELFLRLIVLVTLLLIVMIVRRRTTLDDAAVLGAGLTLYACWALGGPIWLVPPAVALAAYTLVFPNFYHKGDTPHSIHAMVGVTAAGYAALLLKVQDGVDLYLPFAVGYAAQFAMIGIASLCALRSRSAHPVRIAYAVVAASLLIATPAFWLASATAREVFGGLAAIAGGALVFYTWQPNIQDCPTDFARWFRQGMTGFGAAIAAYLIGTAA